jgi:hypothetical protein
MPLLHCHRTNGLSAAAAASALQFDVQEYLKLGACGAFILTHYALCTAIKLTWLSAAAALALQFDVHVYLKLGPARVVTSV